MFFLDLCFDSFNLSERAGTDNDYNMIIKHNNCQNRVSPNKNKKKLKVSCGEKRWLWDDIFRDPKSQNFDISCLNPRDRDFSWDGIFHPIGASDDNHQKQAVFHLLRIKAYK